VHREQALAAVVVNALADAEDSEHLRVEVRTNVKRDRLWKEKRPTMEGKRVKCLLLDCVLLLECVPLPARRGGSSKSPTLVPRSPCAPGGFRRARNP